jgi:hypothetical protein
MQWDSARAHAKSVSPATWCGLAVLVLLLGTLSLVLIGCNQIFGVKDTTLIKCPDGLVPVGLMCERRDANHYTCECDCTGYGQFAAITPTMIIDVRDTYGQAGTVLGQTGPGVQGTIVGGPQNAVLNGVDETWWQVDFASGADGWVVQSQTSIVTGAPLFAKNFDACLPPAFNTNLAGGHSPTSAELASDCSTTRIAPDFARHVGTLPPGATCGCAVTAEATTWAAECDGSAGCTDPSTGEPSVCTVAGSDPEQPTPDPLAAAVFATTSVCQVTDGTATMSVGGHEPKTQPKLHGFLQIHGRPCPPGQGCQVGLAYQLTADDIEFDSGTIFASDPKFVNLSLSGATEPNAIDLGFFLFNIGDVRPGTALTSARGRRAGSSKAIVAALRNSQSVALAVNWESKLCRLSGPLGGQIKGDNDEVLDITVDVDINGVLVNQPPLANAGADRTLECTSPAGAQVTLNGSGSTDRDGNIAFYVWRRDSATGPFVGDPSPAPTRTTRQPLGTTNYSLRVVDADLAADTASVRVNVVDTTVPVISCNAPATIPKLEKPIAFRATATDTCGPAPAVVIENFECLKVKKNGQVKKASCKVAIQGDTLRINKTDGANLIRWRTHAADAASNVGRQTCEVTVAKEKDEDDD